MIIISSAVSREMRYAGDIVPVYGKKILRSIGSNWYKGIRKSIEKSAMISDFEYCNNHLSIAKLRSLLVYALINTH